MVADFDSKILRGTDTQQHFVFSEDVGVEVWRQANLLLLKTVNNKKNVSDFERLY